MKHCRALERPSTASWVYQQQQWKRALDDGEHCKEVMSTPCQHLCIPPFALLPESTHLCLSTESQHQRLQWCCLLTVSTLQFLWSTVWLLDTSHPIFSWSYNDWHNNMFQLTTFFAWWTDVGSSPWNICQYLIHDGKQVFFNSFISGPSTNRLSISPICLKWQSKEYLLLAGYPWVSV